MTATAFDQLEQDDIDAPQQALHPFQARGLGRAPFACIGLERGDGTCSYCGKALKNLFQIKSADERKFFVGSDCVAKTNAILGGFDQYKQRLDVQQRNARKHAREQAKIAKVNAGIEEFKRDNGELFAWLEQQRGGFAGAMMTALTTWGSLTPNQFAALERTRTGQVERRASYQAQAIERAAAAPVVDLAPIEEAFQRGRSAGLKSPKLRLAEFKLKPAKSDSANAGAIYVTEQASGQYLGKVMGGKFLKVRECTDEQQARIVEVCTDPKSAAIAYGRKFGVCCVCARELSDPASVAAGIGPICADNYGF